MLDFLLFPTLPGCEDFLAGFFLQGKAARLCTDEILFPNLLPIDQGQCQTVRQIGTEFLHDIQR